MQYILHIVLGVGKCFVQYILHIVLGVGKCFVQHILHIVSGVGKCFGELALINSDSVRNATIIAEEDCIFMIIDRQLFNNTLKVKKIIQRADVYFYFTSFVKGERRRWGLSIKIGIVFLSSFYPSSTPSLFLFLFILLLLCNFHDN